VSRKIEPLRLSGSTDIAPGATYLRFNRDHLRRTTALSDATEPGRATGAVQKLTRQAAQNIHHAEPGEPWNWWKDLSHRLIAIEGFMKELLASDDAGFECRFDESKKIIELIENPLGRYYYDGSVLHGAAVGDRRIPERYRPRPLVQLFLDVCKQDRFGRYGGAYLDSHPATRSFDGRQYLWEDYNDFLDALRAEGKVRNVAQLDALNDLIAKRRHREMKRFAERCFKKRRRMFILRMDLSYPEAFTDQVSIELAKEHHALFVNRLRALRDIRRNLVGGIWKLEWTLKKGHHFHWVFFFDGSLVKDAQEWANLIDTVWKKCVPQEAGYTHVSNYDKHDVKGTGMIHRDEHAEKFAFFMEEVLGYLAKKDQMLSLKISDDTHTWGRLTIGGKRSSNAGRPPKPEKVRSRKRN
jgi:Inovirus Gp2